MTVPGLPAWAQPDRPAAAPGPVGIIDPPLIQGQADGSCVVFPMSWAPGWGQGYAPQAGGAWDDSIQINQALQQFTTVRLVPGGYNTVATIFPQWFQSIIGHGILSVINHGGNGPAIFMQNPTNPAGDVDGPNLSGQLDRFVVNGTNAGPGAHGITIEDIRNYHVNVLVQDYTGASAVGVYFANNAWSVNHVHGIIYTSNCTTGVAFDVVGGENTMEHFDLHLNCSLQAGQTGLDFRNGVNVFASMLNYTGGTGDPAANVHVNISAGAVVHGCFLNWRAEATHVSTCQSIKFGSNQSAIQACVVIFFFGSNLVASNINALGVFDAQGSVEQDENLIAFMAVPDGYGYTAGTLNTPALTTGTIVNNNTGYNALVTISGTGTLTSAVKINGVSWGDTGTRVFIVPDTGNGPNGDGTIQATFTGSLTWQWQPF
jgi:hypothetical protein